MGEFFKGWRRKAGCVALVMALALFCGRVRSETYSDSLSFPYGMNTRGSIDSENGYVFFESTTLTSQVSGGAYFNTAYCCDPHACYLYYRDQTIGWRFLCFAFGAHQVISDNSATDGPRSLVSARRTWFLSYWTMIAPLTLMAAYLFLWKPRQRRGQVKG